MNWLGTADGDGGTQDAVTDAPADQSRFDIEVADGEGGAAVEKLRPGQPVQARVRGVVHWSGTVETVSISLGVVWIREDVLGERKLLDLQEYQITLHDPRR